MAHIFLREYFLFTRKERNAVLVLAVLLGVFFMLPVLLPSAPVGRTAASDSILLAAAARLSYKDSGYDGEYYRYKYPERRSYAHVYPRYYYPKKGVPYNTNRYSGYRGFLKSGNNAADSVYAKARMDLSAGDHHGKYSWGDKEYHYKRSVTEVPEVFINLADTAAFLPLPGIGMKLAARIIAFRDRLGGFYSIDQVAETYGLPDSTFRMIREKLRLGETEIVRININTADVETLKRHPYIRWNLANAIIEYRKQHGEFRELKELLDIGIITPELYKRMSPYLITGI